MKHADGQHVPTALRQLNHRPRGDTMLSTRLGRAALTLSVAAVVLPAVVNQPAVASSTPPIERVSVTNSGQRAEQASNVGPARIAMSGDGRFVAFYSYAPLTGSPGLNVFVRDRLRGVTTRVNTGPSDVAANPNAMLIGLSADGREVVFYTIDRLVPDDVDDTPDIYVRDLLTGSVRVLQLTTSAGDFTPMGGDFVLSASGRFLAIATVYFPPGTNSGNWAVFLTDMATGGTRMLRFRPLEDNFLYPSVSDDGKRVAYMSGRGVEVYDVDSATVLWNGPPGSIGKLSPDGHLLAYTTREADNTTQVNLVDLDTGLSSRLTAAPGGYFASAGHTDASFSPDSQHLAFLANYPVVPGASWGQNTVFVRDIVTGSTRALPTLDEGVPDGDSASPVVSNQGDQVAFISSATNLVPDDGSGVSPTVGDGPYPWEQRPREDVYVQGPALSTPPSTGSVTASVSEGDTVSTDPAGTGATPTVPVQTQVTVPSGVSGPLSVTLQDQTSTAPAGYDFYGRVVQLEGPVATAEAPYALRFTVDKSLLTSEAGALPAEDVQIFRNGSPVADCTAPGSANPDPCVASRTNTVDGDAIVQVLTSHFSNWSFGRLAYAFTGFQQPVDPLPVINKAKAGSAIPVKFGLGGNRGLQIFSDGRPYSSAASCGGGAEDTVEQTVAATTSGLRYETSTNQYSYVWKTDSTWRGCRTLTLRLRDGTTHAASFKFA